MKYSVNVLLLSTVLSTILISAEPSAFGAGDLTNPTPYGLTSNEKVILDTKEKLHKVAVKSNNQANELDSLRERIDGLQNIVESLSRKSHNNQVNIEKQIEKNSLDSENRSEYDKRLANIVEQNAESLEKQKVLIAQMGLIVDEINTKYVSKDEFNSLVNDVNAFKALIAKELKGSGAKHSASKVESISSSDIYTQAEGYYKKKDYTKAIESYELLIKKNYKPAYSHYMIADMNFKRKNYANAITYYKKSSSLYSKASYMPSLMLNTAISMSKTGDSEHANAFFDAIVKKFPNSVEAKEAAKYLQP